MAFLVLTHADVEHLLAMPACIELMAGALKDLALGELRQPLRSVYAPPGAPVLMAWMPAYRSGVAAGFGMKLLCVIPDNPTRGLDGHQGAIVLLDGTTGQLRALVDASAITAIRTAAVTAVATRLLAREDARVLALVGTGVQAQRHLAAIPLVRPIERVLVAGRTPERACEFVARVQPHTERHLEAAESVEAAVCGADIVVTATTAREPVLLGAWLRPGTHVNAIGASQPTHREIDVTTWATATAFVDRRESVEREATDYQQAWSEGMIGAEQVPAELGDLLLGRVAGRTSVEQVTLFRSLGLASEDLVAAQYVVDRALEASMGTRVEF